MYNAKLIRFASFAAGGATGLVSGLVYNKIFAAHPVALDVDKILSSGVEGLVNYYAPAMRHGFPTYDCLRIKENFVLSYDRRNRNANWVMEHLTSEDLAEGEANRRKRCRKFREDKTIHDYFRTTGDDYSDSGYTKGHLAAAGNHKHSLEAWQGTFVLSNISPQDEFFNRGIWEKLESHVRKLVKHHGSAYVCTGPLYLPRELSIEEEEVLQNPDGHQKKRKRGRNHCENASVQQRRKQYVIYEVIGENNVAVPTHFFKIIVYETTDKMYNMEAYVIPNKPIDPQKTFTDFIVPRDAIERYAGFLLFHQLPPENIRHITKKPMEDGRYLTEFC